MSTSLGVIIQRLAMIFIVALVAFGVILLFSYDVIKIAWPSFMEIQPTFKQMEHPLPPPERSIPVEGAAYIPGTGLPQNPTPPDENSIKRGAELFAINCQMCHGPNGEGNGTVAPFLLKFKPANLTSPMVQAFSDGQIFGAAGREFVRLNFGCTRRTLQQQAEQGEHQRQGYAGQLSVVLAISKTCIYARAVMVSQGVARPGMG